MKVKDLISEMDECREAYPDFLEWDVYTEQLGEFDKDVKRGKETVRCSNGVLDQSGWGKITSSEGWEFFKCEGFCYKYPKEKIFTVNVNY